MATKHAVGPAVQKLWNKGVIKKERKSLKVLQKDFAKMLDVPVSKLRNWEKLKPKPELEEMLTIFQTLRTLKVSKHLI